MSDDQVKSSMPVWVWRTIIGAGSLAGVFLTFFSVLQVFDNRMEKEFTTQSEKIIHVINNKSERIVDFHKDDLWDRIQILETEINSRRARGEEIPERMSIHIRSMKERYQEMKNPW